MPGTVTYQKTVIVNFRVTPQDKAEIERRARLEARTVSDWARLVVLGTIQQGGNSS